MYLVINKCVTAVKVSNFSGHYLRNRSNLDISVLSYIGIVQHKEHSPEVLSIPPGTPCINKFYSYRNIDCIYVIYILDFYHEEGSNMFLRKLSIYLTIERCHNPDVHTMKICKYL